MDKSPHKNAGEKGKNAKHSEYRIHLYQKKNVSLGGKMKEFVFFVLEVAFLYTPLVATNQEDA